jgi:uroporphyrinogen-III synthase
MVQKTPLKGRVVAITRPVGQAEEAGELIRAKGGVPYYIPAIEIKGLSNPEPMKGFIKELTAGTVDYIILMSTNGVKHLFSAADEIDQTKQLHEGLQKACVIAVGPKTAEAMKEFKVRIDMVPEKYSSEGLLEALKGTKLEGKKIRIPRTSNATPTLTNQLREQGADVEEIHVYESGLPVDEELKTKFYTDLVNGRINALLFGSGLSAKNIFKMLTEKASMETLRQIIARNVTVVAIGPTTAEALCELDIKVDVIPDDYLFDKALDALEKYWLTNTYPSAN